jgi:hypothetical protein
VSLGLLDAMLSDFEHWMSGGEIRAAMYHRTNHFTVRQIRRIHEHLGEMRHLIAQLRDDLRLNVRCEDVATMVWSRAASFGETLAETDSMPLRGHGNVSPVLAAYLDPGCGS